MRNTDTLLLEEAYSGIINEMGKLRNYSIIGSLPPEGRANIKSLSEMDAEARKVNGGALIDQSFKRLEQDPNDIEAAWMIYNTVYNFPHEREDFLVNGEEMSYYDIIRKLLQATTTQENDPNLIVVRKDPTTGEKIPGLTIDEYVYGQKGGHRGIRTPIPGRDKEHYYLFKTLLQQLPDTEVQARNVGGRAGAEEIKDTANDVYYITSRYKAYDSQRQHIGYYERGVGFYPNELGGSLGYDWLKVNEFKAHRKKNPRGSQRYIGIDEVNDIEKRPFKTYVRVDKETGLTGRKIMTSGYSRTPKVKTEPPYNPVPDALKGYADPEICSKPLIDVKAKLDSKEAETLFRDMYPPETCPSCYKHGGKKDGDTKFDIDVPGDFMLNVYKGGEVPSSEEAGEGEDSSEGSEVRESFKKSFGKRIVENSAEAVDYVFSDKDEEEGSKDIPLKMKGDGMDEIRKLINSTSYDELAAEAEGIIVPDLEAAAELLQKNPEKFKQSVDKYKGQEEEE